MILDLDVPFATVTLNRPEKRNALALDVMLEVTEAFRTVGASRAIGAILAANGPVFSAGHNFADMAGADLEAGITHLFEVCTEMMNTIQSIPQPVIAKVHALATAAGCQLVASCDLAIAAESAGFATPGGKGGLFCHTPLVAVARNIGRKRAMQMALTGDQIDAATAASWGLINYAVPDDQLDSAVHDLLSRRNTRQHRIEGCRQARLLCPDRAWPDRRVHLRGRRDGRGCDQSRRPGGHRRVPRQAESRSTQTAPDAAT